jgi:hypothetical protein
MPSDGKAPSPHRLYTWFWRDALRADVADELVLVRTSLGKPRWAMAIAKHLPYIHELAPAGFFNEPDDDEFRRLYVDLLEHHGVDFYERRFEDIRAKNDGLPLALLCFEHDRRECHRSYFAEWWEEKTGEEVPEWGCYVPPAKPAPEPEPAQGSLL